MQKTPIDYLTHTWNPIAMRCTPCSPGCAECWHIARCDMFKNNPKFSKELREIYAGGRPPKLIGSRLNNPIKTKDHARIGVQFMGDLCMSGIKERVLTAVFSLMDLASQHTYVLLTKRPKRLLDIGFCSDYHKNVWVGVTVCDKEEKFKIDILRQIPAVIRWISFEPLLENVGEINLEGIHWCVVGGETGSGARPMHPAWARSIMRQCQTADIPYFFKQHGSWYNNRIGWDKERSRFLNGKIWEQYPNV